MAHERKFRFGVQLTGTFECDDWADLARRTEDCGYSTLFITDHFADQLAPVPALMAAADATTTLRVGSMVLGVDFRHPAAVAKEIATIDVLSSGRVELGIGAGWMNADYHQTGMTKDPDGVRIQRLEEALMIIKALWGPEPVDFRGRYYEIHGLDGAPKPVQQPHPPMIVGGGGPKVLGVAARHADIVALFRTLTRGEIDVGFEARIRETANDLHGKFLDNKVAHLRDAAGPRFEDLELSTLVLASEITSNRQDAVERIATAAAVPHEQIQDMPYVWLGSVEQIADQLRAARDRWGISYWLVQGVTPEKMAPIVAELTGT